MNSKQRGMICIPYEIVRENPQYVFDIFQKIGFLPVDTQWKLDAGVILYTGYSAKFQTSHYNESPRYFGVSVTVREPGVVLDADVTFDLDSVFGEWRKPGVSAVPEFAMKPIMEGRAVCCIDVENRAVMSSYGDCAPVEEVQNDLNTGEIFESDFLEGVKDGYVWIERIGYDPGETQYGTGYGDVLTIPGYFMWELLRHIPGVKPEAEPVVIESTEPF
jgi:hypothetical protein